MLSAGGPELRDQRTELGRQIVEVFISKESSRVAMSEVVWG